MRNARESLLLLVEVRVLCVSVQEPAKPVNTRPTELVTKAKLLGGAEDEASHGGECAGRNAMAATAMAMPTLNLAAHPIWHWHWQRPPCTRTTTNTATARLHCHTLLSPRTVTPASRSLARDLVARAAIDSTTTSMPQQELGAILLVGVTGGTGGSVVNGLLASGVDSSELRVLTRSPGGVAARSFTASGIQAVAGDLDDPNSLNEVLRGVKAIYCHATSKDAAKADPAGDVRAETLAKAAASAGVKHIVYNSTGGGGHGISQVEQKHNIENIFRDSGIPTTNLRATMFMEEFWKVYTRPQILKGRFPFSMPSDKPLQLVAVKDMGLAAGIALKEPEEYGGVSLELAGDELTPAQMCEAYSKAQGSNVSHFSPPKFLFWFLNRDLYRIAKFLSEKGYEADIADCRKRFPGLLTFNEFLELTHWGDASRNYADGFKY